MNTKPCTEAEAQLIACTAVPEACTPRVLTVYDLYVDCDWYEEPIIEHDHFVL